MLLERHLPQWRQLLDQLLIEIDRIHHIFLTHAHGDHAGGEYLMRTSYEQIATTRIDGPNRVSPFFIPMAIANMPAGVSGIMFGAQGPNYSTTSACASSGHALGESYEIIKRGDADMMVAGGCEAPVADAVVAGFARMKALSTRNDDPEAASRPFDADRDGFVVAEGAASLILEELEHARGEAVVDRVEHYLEYPDDPHPMAHFQEILGQMGLYVFVTTWVAIVLTSVLACLFLRSTRASAGLYPSRGLAGALLLYLRLGHGQRELLPVADALVGRLVAGDSPLELLEAGVLAHAAPLCRHGRRGLGRQLRECALVVARHDLHELRQLCVPFAKDGFGTLGAGGFEMLLDERLQLGYVIGVVHRLDADQQRGMQRDVDLAQNLGQLL